MRDDRSGNAGYRNTEPDYRPPERSGLFRFLSRRIMGKLFNLKKRATGGDFWKSLKLETVQADDAGNTNLATWIGHSTLLCRQSGVWFLTDPIFSRRASPFSFAGPLRYTLPSHTVNDLPKIRFILISHNHYDHLDKASVVELYKKDKPLFLVPEGLGEWFVSAGIDSVLELPWWSEHSIGGLRVTAVPAQHFSARSLWDRNSSHWCGWLVSGSKNFYYSGDTGYYGIFREIGRRAGGIDLAVLPIGAYEPQSIMKRHHLTPEEALKAFAELGGKKFLAVHWGTFDLTDEPHRDPPERLMKEANSKRYQQGVINVTRVGQTVNW